jgi:predicted nucleotidyltransferase
MEVLKKLEKNGIMLKKIDLVRLCEKYKLSELSVFGSSLRDDFHDGSDIDFLVSFIDYFKNKPFDIIYLELDFATLLNRKIDIVCKDALKNQIRREEIMSTREVLYEYKQI